MRAGTLRERVTLQKLADAGGGDAWGPSTVWVDGHRVWGSVQAEAGSESAGDHAVMTAVTYTIRVRYLPDVTSKWRVLWNGKALDIVSCIDPTGRRRELEIKAVENVTNG